MQSTLWVKKQDTELHQYKPIFKRFSLMDSVVNLQHTHTHLTAFFRDYPGKPVPER